MELNYLQEFVTLARNCHFQEAAAQLFISQSSLSKHIKAIEAEFGQELFNRSTRKVELSEFGKAFLPYAVKIAEIQQDYNQNLLYKDDPRRKTVRIGISQLVMLNTMRNLLVDFGKDRPGYKIQIVDLDDTPLQDVLGKGKCNLVIAHPCQNDDLSAYSSILYTQDSLVALLPENHPLAKEKAVSKDQLAESNFIQLGRTNLARELDESFSVSHTINRPAALMNLIAEGVGVGITTRKYAITTSSQKIKIIPIVPKIMLNINIYYPDHLSSNPGISYILNWFQNRK